MCEDYQDRNLKNIKKKSTVILGIPLRIICKDPAQLPDVFLRIWFNWKCAVLKTVKNLEIKYFEVPKFFFPYQSKICFCFFVFAGRILFREIDDSDWQRGLLAHRLFLGGRSEEAGHARIRSRKKADLFSDLRRSDHQDTRTELPGICD